MITRSSVVVSIKRREDCQDLALPSYQSSGSSGMDIYAAIDQPIILNPHQIVKVSTGMFLEIPQGYEAQIRPRSGLALRHGISMVNTPGTIDSDYRGEVCIILINLGSEPFQINRGERIAQMVFAPVVQIAWHEKDCLTSTERGQGGFGSTGI